MEFLEAYGIFLFAVAVPFVGFGNWAIARQRLPDLPGADAFWARFHLVLYGSMSGYFLFLGLMQLLGGFDSFFYIFESRDHFNVFVLAPRVVILGLWVAGLWWIALAGGAQKLMLYPVLIGPTGSPFLLKMYSVLIIVGLVVILIVFYVTGFFE